MKRGWLVNDALTCIPGTKTLWHHLLEWIPGLVDKTGDPFAALAARVERDTSTERGFPDYVIRNATYFRALAIPRPTISLLQDVRIEPGVRAQQLDVCRRSARVVVNSRRTLDAYPELDKWKTTIVPLGVDFDFFRPGRERHPDVAPGSILWVGAMNDHPKGFDRLRALIDEVDHPFCLVLKDGGKFSHPRVKVFSRVDAARMARIYNSCAMLVCTSREETQHLAGIEAMACGIPVVSTWVGVYRDLESPGPWGQSTVPKYLTAAVRGVYEAHDKYAPRGFVEDRYGLDACRKAWQQIVKEVTA